MASKKRSRKTSKSRPASHKRSSSSGSFSKIFLSSPQGKLKLVVIGVVLVLIVLGFKGSLLSSKGSSPTPAQDTEINQSTTGVPEDPTVSTSYASPAPTKYSPDSYSMKGATLSTLFADVTLDPGKNATAFSVTSTGAHSFKLTETRMVSVTGITFSPMEEGISMGQTKNITVIVASDVKPGTYTGFVSIKLDTGDEKQVRLTVKVNGETSTSGKSLKVTGPAGGSTYNSGDSITITWESSGISEDFELGVSSENGTDYDFVTRPNSDRSYTWSANKFFDPTATHFRFFVIAGDQRSESSSFITIN